MKRYLSFFLFILILSAQLSAELKYSDKIIQKGKTLVGTPYVYGGDTAGGFDCSGLVFHLYRPYFDRIGRTVTALAEQGVSITKEQLQAGDLIFYATGSTSEPTHVSIYVGDNKNLHAISRGINRGVNITSLDSNYWKKRVLYYRRILPLLDSSDEKETVIVEDEVVIDEKKEDSRKDKSDIKDEKEEAKDESYDDWKDKDSDDFKEWQKNH